MKKKEKRMILILIVVAIAIIAILWFVTRPKQNDSNVGNSGTTASTIGASEGEFTKVEEDGTVANTSEKFKEVKNEQGFEISDIEFKEKNGETVLTASVTNMTDSIQKSFWGNIVLLDKSGNEIGKIPVMIPDTQKGETIRIEASITESYANAYNFKLEK